MAHHAASVPSSEIENLLRAPSGAEFRTTERLVAPFFNCRFEVTIEGTDGLVRPHPHIPAHLFDGTTLPFSFSSFDVVMFTDALHRTLVRRVFLPNAMHVGKRIPAEDHLREELLTPNCALWIENAHRGIALQYNYCCEAQRAAAFDELSWKTSRMTTSEKLYWASTSWMFDHRRHFVVRFQRGAAKLPI